MRAHHLVRNSHDLPSTVSQLLASHSFHEDEALKIKPLNDPDDVLGGYQHWCPGCKQRHFIPIPRWGFNGNMEKPTFTPSVKLLRSRYKEGKEIPGTEESYCHYVLTDGILNYQGDCAHELRGTQVPLPDLPDERTDGDKEKG